MACKFKQTKAGATSPSCKVTCGECQFRTGNSDSKCPIANAFKDLDPAKCIDPLESKKS